MTTFELMTLIREALQGHDGIERVETLAQHEGRAQRDAAHSGGELLAPPPRSRRNPVPEDVLYVTLGDHAEFAVKIVRLADPDRDEFEEGDPPWQKRP